MHWKDIFQVIDGKNPARQRCSLCGVELDVRAGRARKHAEGHEGAGAVVNGDSEPLPDKEAPVPDPVEVEEEAPREKKSKMPPIGSREWAVMKVLTVADSPAATPEQTLKALDLLKDFEGFESAGTFDDEIEKQKHLEQWERAFSRAQDTRSILKKLIKDPTVRFDIERDLREC